MGKTNLQPSDHFFALGGHSLQAIQAQRALRDALVGQEADFKGIGIDLDPNMPLPSDLTNIVLTPSERISAGVTEDPGLCAKIVFSAKEAAYKCQYSRSKRLLEFGALEITCDKNRLEACFAQGIPPYRKGQILSGRLLQLEEMILTFFTDPVGAREDAPS